MPTWPLWAWLCWSLAALFGVAAIALFLKGLFPDGWKRRRHCPKCWYDLSAVMTLQCSECGYTAPRERKLWKRHRSWLRLALVLPLMLFATAGALWPKINRTVGGA